MKEYISKAILLNVIERNTTWNTNEAFEGLIKNIPIITKADIFEDIKREIKKMKSEVDSTNSDYNTGYISALSTLEGLLAKMGSEK